MYRLSQKSSVKDLKERLCHFFRTRFLIKKNKKLLNLAISTSFKKELSILSHIAKTLQARQFPQNCLSEKVPGSKSFVNFFWIYS